MEKRKKIILGFVFALGIFLTFFQFTDTPNVWLDEGAFTETAKNVALYGIVGLQTSPGVFFQMNSFVLSTGYPVIFPVALSLKTFGLGVWQARLPMLLYMCLLILLFYIFAKKKYGFYPAITAVLGLISFSPFYGNGRPVQGEVPGLVFLVLGALLLLLWEKSGFTKKKYLIFSGLSLGLAAATKPIFLLGVPLALCITLAFSWKKIQNKKILALFISGLLVPIILWFFIPPPTLDSLSKIIPTYVYLASNHGSSVSTLQTIWTNALRFFTESTPILFSIIFIAIVVSFGFRLFKKNNINISIAEIFVGAFIVVNVGGYLAGTGWYRYFFPAHALLYILFGPSILALAESGVSKIWKISLYIFLGGVLAFQFYHLIFLSDTAYVVERTRNVKVAEVLSHIDTSQSVLFYGSPEVLIMYPGREYSHYLAIANTLDTGNIDIFKTGSFDVVFTRRDFHAPEDESKALFKCYKRTVVDRYFLFEKIKGCK